MIFAAIADRADADQYPVAFMCEQLGVSRSGYYAWRGRAVSDRELRDGELKTLIAHFHAAGRGNPGVRRIWADLAAAGHRVGRKRVHRLLRCLGLQGRHPRSWKVTTTPGDRPVGAPDLIGREFTATAANRRWVGDVTYVRTWDGWAHLATVIDLHWRKVVGWALADHMRTSFVTDALEMALETAADPAA